MKIEDLRGNIFFEKDDEEKNLSELLYAPFLKILNSHERNQFAEGIGDFLFLMTWDNIIMSEKIRNKIFDFLTKVAFCQEEERSDLAFSFFHAVSFSSKSNNYFRIKNLIDIKTKKKIPWENLFSELGINFH